MGARALVYEPEHGLRSIVLSQMRAMGFARILDCADDAGIEQLICCEDFDLLICTVRDGGGRALELIRRLRMAEIGCDPFVPIILTTWQPTQRLVGQAINAGTDVLIAKPFSNGQLTEAIHAIIRRRRGFVRTATYMGPDRRRAAARGAHDELIEVPNALKAKAEGAKTRPKPEETLIAIDRLKDARLRRDSSQITHLVGLLEDIAGEPEDAAGERRELIEDLTRTAVDLRDAARDSNLPHFGQLAAALSDLLFRFEAVPLPVVSRQQLELLRNAARAVEHALAEDPNPTLACRAAARLGRAVRLAA